MDWAFAMWNCEIRFDDCTLEGTKYWKKTRDKICGALKVKRERLPGTKQYCGSIQ